MHTASRLAIMVPRAENGLKYNQRFYATKAGEAAGLKYDPEGVRCFRFFSDAKLLPGDEMIPLLTAKGTNGKDGVGAYVVRFGSELKGAQVLTGSADGRSGSSEAAQARNCFDMIEISRQVGSESLFFYEFRAKEKEPFYSEDHFGIVHRDFTPKSAYEALRRR